MSSNSLPKKLAKEADIGTESGIVNYRPSGVDRHSP
jgi:hypothetical protein